MNYLENFKKEKNLIERFKEENAYLCWVMALYLDRNDVYELGTDNLTDGKNDRKIVPRDMRTFPGFGEASGIWGRSFFPF